MPNKRAENKKIVSTYIDDELKVKLKEVARARGKTLTDVVTELIEREVIREKAKAGDINRVGRKSGKPTG